MRSFPRTKPFRGNELSKKLGELQKHGYRSENNIQSSTTSQPSDARESYSVIGQDEHANEKLAYAYFVGFQLEQILCKTVGKNFDIFLGSGQTSNSSNTIDEFCRKASTLHKVIEQYHYAALSRGESKKKTLLEKLSIELEDTIADIRKLSDLKKINTRSKSTQDVLSQNKRTEINDGKALKWKTSQGRALQSTIYNKPSPLKVSHGMIDKSRASLSSSTVNVEEYPTAAEMPGYLQHSAATVLSQPTLNSPTYTTETSRLEKDDTKLGNNHDTPVTSKSVHSTRSLDGWTHNSPRRSLLQELRSSIDLADSLLTPPASRTPNKVPTYSINLSNVSHQPEETIVEDLNELNKHCEEVRDEFVTPQTQSAARRKISHILSKYTSVEQSRLEASEMMKLAQKLNDLVLNEVNADSPSEQYFSPQTQPARTGAPTVTPVDISSTSIETDGETLTFAKMWDEVYAKMLPKPDEQCKDQVKTYSLDLT